MLLGCEAHAAGLLDLYAACALAFARLLANVRDIGFGMPHDLEA